MSWPLTSRKVDIRLHGKGNSKSPGARPVNKVIQSIWWTRTRRLSIKNSPSLCPLIRALRFRLATALMVAVPWTQVHVGGYLDRIFELGRYAALKHPDTFRKGGGLFLAHHNTM